MSEKNPEEVTSLSYLLDVDYGMVIEILTEMLITENKHGWDRAAVDKAIEYECDDYLRSQQEEEYERW